MLKVDGWRVLTLHSTLKIEEGVREEREWGVITAELAPSLFLEAGQAQAFSRPVNDAVLPSGRLLKATCHIFSIAEGLVERGCTSVPHVSTGTDRCHVATSAIVSTHLPQIGPLTEYHTVHGQSIYNTLTYSESTGTLWGICLLVF